MNVADKQVYKEECVFERHGAPKLTVCKEECVFEWHGVPKLTELYEMESRPFQHGKTKSCVRKNSRKSVTWSAVPDAPMLVYFVIR